MYSTEQVGRMMAEYLYDQLGIDLHSDAMLEDPEKYFQWIDKLIERYGNVL